MQGSPYHRTEKLSKLLAQVGPDATSRGYLPEMPRLIRRQAIFSSCAPNSGAPAKAARLTGVPEWSYLGQSRFETFHHPIVGNDPTDRRFEISCRGGVTK
jgi:hypothetical protein